MTKEKDNKGNPTSSEKLECAIDFSSFVLSLATTAMSHLGEVPDPATGKHATSLDEAKQIIDILCMLKEKTIGNLSPEESRMIEQLLYELRMKYLSKSSTHDL